MRKQYSAALKAQIVLEMFREDRSVSQIAAEHGIHPQMLHRWRREVVEQLPELFAEPKIAQNLAKAHEEQVQTLYAQIGKLTTQLAWLKKKSGLDPEP